MYLPPNKVEANIFLSKRKNNAVISHPKMIDTVFVKEDGCQAKDKGAYHFPDSPFKMVFIFTAGMDIYASVIFRQ